MKELGSRDRELLNVDARNKNGVSILNPYGELSTVLIQDRHSKQADPLIRSRRRGRTDTNSTRPYKEFGH